MPKFNIREYQPNDYAEVCRIHDVSRKEELTAIDSAKTVGLVNLPGMMSGLIFAGVNPIYAIKYQIMVTFMLLSATSLGAIISVYLAYKNYFNDQMQLML